jgi:hypothetical protein
MRAVQQLLVYIVPGEHEVHVTVLPIFITHDQGGTPC